MEIELPSTPRRQQELTRDERLRFRILYYDAKWPMYKICKLLGCTVRQAQYALDTQPTPQRKGKCGRKVLINSLSSKSPPSMERYPCYNWMDCKVYAISTALKAEGFN
jgi:hypothetical protein